MRVRPMPKKPLEEATAVAQGPLTLDGHDARPTAQIGARSGRKTVRAKPAAADAPTDDGIANADDPALDESAANPSFAPFILAQANAGESSPTSLSDAGTGTEGAVPTASTPAVEAVVVAARDVSWSALAAWGTAFAAFGNSGDASSAAVTNTRRTREQLAALTSAQVAAMSTTEFAALDADDLAALSPEGLSGLTPEQVGTLDSTEIAALGTDIANLNSTAMGSLSGEQVATMSTMLMHLAN